MTNGQPGRKKVENLEMKLFLQIKDFNKHKQAVFLTFWVFAFGSLFAGAAVASPLITGLYGE